MVAPTYPLRIWGKSISKDQLLRGRLPRILSKSACNAFWKTGRQARRAMVYVRVLALVSYPA